MPATYQSRASAATAPRGSRLYAIGDVHGRIDLLDRLLALIEADAATSPAARRVVVFLGDYVDRGPCSRQVIDRLAAGPPPGFEWIALDGNHEAMMRSFLEDPSTAPAWLRNGGDATLASYVGASPRIGDIPADLRGALAEALPGAHLRFLSRLGPSHVEGGYFFAHAGVRPGVALESQSRDDLLWIRGPFLDHEGSFGRVVVHGHSIAPRPVDRHNRIGVDTGAYASGRLTALVAEGDWHGFLAAFD
ncbi:MAG: serine/threonine protein phosphatase [Alphaproteobacteria bacterium]|nr:serine/threonine protein phosphatase [Alphaproteobacteria bacterium]